MANWDDIINNRLTMGRLRQLCYVQSMQKGGGERMERRRGNQG